MDDNSKPLKIVMLGCERELLQRLNKDIRPDKWEGIQGLYKEGTPENEDNQPILYFCRKQGEISFENLEHEFWHYLDGKYIRFGDTQNISPDKVLWWAEGSAEYNTASVSKHDLKDELKTFSQNELPTLEEIISPNEFNTSKYMNINRAYVHSVWVHAFLDSSPEMRAFRKEIEIALRNEGKTEYE